MGSATEDPLSFRPRVFLSYARADAEEIAIALRRRLELEEPELKVWHDRARMQGGRGWRAQIEEALDQVKFAVMLMTPAALRSEECQWEWRYARQRGVAVCPVMVDPAVTQLPEFDRLPRSMRKVHWYNLQREWETFCLHLKSPPELRRVPFMAPTLTSFFTPRPTEFESLIRLLLSLQERRSVAISTAIHGAGGYGKTTLAIAACHDERLQEAYDDGILWVTLGQTPNLLRELTKLYEAISGERPDFMDIEDGSRRVADLLETRSFLLVIDDIWHRDHLAPFMRGGPSCKRLITTRNASLIDQADRVEVDAMLGKESIELLVSRLRDWHDQVASQRSELNVLARRLLHWPLLLKLAAGQLRARLERNDSLQKAIEYVDRALVKKGLTAFDVNNATQRSDAVRATLSASLSELDSVQVERLRSLAVFPEDVELPLAVIIRYWGLDDIDTEELAVRLDELSLLDLDLGKATLKLHDEVRLYLAQWLIADQGFAAAHARLVDALPEPTGEEWEESSRYALRWKVYHCMLAGRDAQAKRYLFDFDWLFLKVTHLHVQSLLDDFEYLPPDVVQERPVHMLRRTLQMIAHVLIRSPAQLAPQLLARLPQGEVAELDALRDAISQWRGAIWLQPLLPQMLPPGALLRTIEVGDRLTNLAMSPDGARVFAGGRMDTDRDDRACRAWSMLTGGRVAETEGVHGNHWADMDRTFIDSTGSRILVGSTLYGDFYLHDVETLSLLAKLPGRGMGSGMGVFSPDGAIIATYDGTDVHVWDAADGALVCSRRHITTCPEDTYAWTISALAFSPDGRHLASSDIGGICLWEVCRNTLSERPVVIETPRVNCLAFSPDSSHLVSGGDDRALRFWHTESGAPLASPVTRHESPIVHLAFNADGSRIVSLGDKSDVFWLWDAGTRQPIEVGPMWRHEDVVSSVCFSPDGQLLASGSFDHSLQLWDTRTGLAIGEPLIAHRNRVGSVMFSPDGTRLVSTGYDDTIRLWDVVSVRSSVSAALRRVTCVAHCTRTARAVMGDSMSMLQQWDVDQARPVGPVMRRQKSPIVAVAYSEDGSCIAASDADHLTCVWDATTGRQIVRPMKGARRGAHQLGFSPDGSRVFCRDPKAVRVWNTASGLQIGDPLFRTDSLAATIEVSPNGDRFVFQVPPIDDYIDGYQPGEYQCQLFDLADGQHIAQLRGQLLATVFSPDSSVLVTVNGRHVLLWDAKSGELVGSPMAVPAEFNDQVTSVAFSADSSRVVAGYEGGAIQVWNTRTTLPVGPAIQTRLAYGVSFVCFDPNGARVLAYGGASLSLWDVQAGDSLRPIRVRDPEAPEIPGFTDAVFSPDGSFVMSTQDDGRVALRNAASGEVLTAVELDTGAYNVSWMGQLITVQDKHGTYHPFRAILTSSPR